MPVSLYSTPIDEITRDTIQELIDEGAEEGQLLDFKRTLMAEGEDVDPWEDGQNRIGNYAKGGLARAVCSFANASGGWVLLGIDERRESEDEPPVADSIYRLPRVVALASRLNQALFDSIDPKPVGLVCRGLPLEDDGSGIVIIRQPPSIDAPHRVDIKGQREAYLRVGDRNERMSMRQIRDRVLASSSLLADVENSLSKARERFLAHRGVRGCRLGYRITAALTSPPIRSRRVYRQDHLAPRALEVSLRHAEGADYVGVCVGMRNVQGHRLEPRLRGSEIEVTADYYDVRLTILEAGVVDFAFWPKRDDPPEIYLGWLLGDTMAVLDLMSRLREFFGLADAEFALELSIYADGEGHLVSFGDKFNQRQVGFSNLITTPAIRVTGTSEFSEAAISILNDLYNSVGWPDLPEGVYVHDARYGTDPNRPDEAAG